MFLSKLKTTLAFLVALAVVGTRAPSPTAPAGGPAGEARRRAPRDGVKPKGNASRDADKPKDPDRRADGEKPRRRPPGREGEAPAGEDVNLTGVISKQERKGVKEDGQEIAITTYYLTEAGGNKVQVPGPRFGDGGRVLDAVSVADFVGKQVTVKGKAFVARAGEAPDAPRRIAEVRRDHDRGKEVTRRPSLPRASRATSNLATLLWLLLGSVASCSGWVVSRGAHVHIARMLERLSDLDGAFRTTVDPKRRGPRRSGGLPGQRSAGAAIRGSPPGSSRCSRRPACCGSVWLPLDSAYASEMHFPIACSP